MFYNHLNVPDECIKELAHDNIRQSVMNCHACKYSQLTKPLMLNNPKAHLVLIGEKPDDVLFETPQGELLLNCLKKHDIALKDVYFTSLIKCQESSEYDKCQHHLISELMVIRPVLVVCLGYTVSKMFVDNPVVGEYYSDAFPSTVLLTTYSFRDALQDSSQKILEYLHQQFAYIINSFKGMSIA